MTRVPYEQLDRAEKAASRAFPHATRVKALWTPTGEHEIHVEVWANGSASIHAVIA